MRFDNTEGSVWSGLDNLVRPACTEVHIWQANLDLPARALAACRRHLSADERTRADRFAFDHDRQRFIAARGILRLLIAGYLKVNAANIRFRYSAEGKPFLAYPELGDGLVFNLSHSLHLGVYAFARNARVGIDIEFHRPLADFRQIATKVFSATELRTLDTVPAAQQLAAFYAGWTRKEAFVKAVGQGLSYPLKEITVTLTPDGPAQLVAIGGEAGSVAHWSMASFVPQADFSGAVVVDRPSSQISFRQFDISTYG